MSSYNKPQQHQKGTSGAAPIRKKIVRTSPAGKNQQSSASSNGSSKQQSPAIDTPSEYIMDRAKSAFQAYKPGQYSNMNDALADHVPKFQQKVDHLLKANDDLLENVEARHLIKSIYSCTLLNEHERKQNKKKKNKIESLDDKKSPACDLAVTFGKCTHWLPIKDSLIDDKNAFWWLHQISVVAMTLANHDEQFCKSAAFHGEKLMVWMRDFLAFPRVQKLHPEDKSVRQICEFVLAALHNVARHDDLRPKMSQLGLAGSLDFYFTCVDETAQCIALMLTAAVSTEDQLVKLDDKYEIIPKMTRVLESALNDESDHMFNGFAAEELAQSISLLMVNDANKKAFVDSGILAQLKRMLSSTLEHRADDEKLWAIDCLWQLSTSEAQRQLIVNDNVVMASLKTLADDKRLSLIKMKANRAVDFITNGGSQKMTSLAEKHGGEKKITEEHIFISYNWKHQDVCVKIRDFLKSIGYKVWIDIDEMTGSTLESMARAIEQAKVVLICFSDDYKASANCRIEAEYSFQRKKPIVAVSMQLNYNPDGWLGILLGQFKSVDLSLTTKPFDTAKIELKNEIEAHVLNSPQKKTEQTGKESAGATTVVAKSGGETTGKQAATAGGGNSVVVQAKLSAKKALTISFVKSQTQGWSEGEVGKWLEGNSLSASKQTASLFKSMNGRQLAVIYEMKMLSPELFYSTLLKNFENNLIQVLKVSEALERLPGLLAKK